MKNDEWIEIKCQIPDFFSDEFADFLLELTGNGVSVDNRAVDTFNVDDIPVESDKEVKCYISEAGMLESTMQNIREYLTRHADVFAGKVIPQPVAEQLRQEDWANSWKSNFKPTRIGSRLVIKPSWEDYQPVTGDIVLELDPGMAFGTGTHGTTRLCLEALEKLIYDEKSLLISAAVLDVGCGSGLLGIAAALFGATPVVAVDIDPIAVEVTVENAAINAVSRQIEASLTPLAEVAGEFGIVLANILAEELVKMKDGLVAKCAQGGFIVLSGILLERKELVLNGFCDIRLSLHSVETSDEWCCIVFKKVAE